MPDQCPQPTATEIGGRSSRMEYVRTEQVFGAFTDANGWLRTGFPTEAGWKTERYKHERLFRLRSFASQLVRLEADAQTPVPLATLQTEVLPPGVVGSFGGESLYKLLVHVDSELGESRFLVDIGPPLELAAKGMDIAIVGPQNAYRVTPNQQEARGGSGRAGGDILVDANVRVSIVQTEFTVTDGTARFSEHIHVPAGQQVSFVVPPYARAVKIYKAAPGAVTQFTRWVGDPAVGGLQVGSLNFTAANASEDNGALLGDETHFRTDADGAARSFLVVWTIKPGP